MPARVRLGGLVRLAGVLDGDAHLRRQVRALAVHVDRHVAVEHGEPVDDQLLADLGGGGLDRLGDRPAVLELRREQRLDVGRLGPST